MKHFKKLAAKITSFIVLIFGFHLSCTQDALLDQKNAVIEKPIVVIIPSYNNAQWVQQNITSVLNQKYQNFRVIYINDSSTDKTVDLVKEHAQKLGLSHKIWIINNKTRRGALANIYAAVHTCKNNEIVAIVDGDDWLYNDQVLAKVNAVYADSKVWMTYGHYIAHPDYKPLQPKEISPVILQKSLYRQWDFVTSHLRTYYAGLFKQIKLEDLIYQGNFFEVNADLATMLPMLEMAAGRVKCIFDTLYIYNCATPINDFKTKLLQQIHCEKIIRGRKKYEPLGQSPIDTQAQNFKASIIIFSHDSPAHLYGSLETIEKYVHAINNVSVIYQASNEQILELYQEVQKRFVGLQYARYAQNNFKPILLSSLIESNEYVVLMHDGVLIKDFMDLSECAQYLQKTGAYSFYLSLGKNITQNALLSRTQQFPGLLSVKDDVYAWQFLSAEHDWRTTHINTMAMLRKKDVLRAISELNFDNPIDLELAYKTVNQDLNAIGLCFEESKALIVGGVSKTALELFALGSKFDTVEFFRVANSSIILNQSIPFIVR